MHDLLIEIDDLILVDTNLVAQVERDKAYRLRERMRNHHKGEKGKAKPYAEREFVFWDGEGPQDTGYSLFGNSDGREICHPSLATTECLDTLLQASIDSPDNIHCGFGLNYDVSMILKDLSWRHLNALKHFNKTVWRDYEIEYVPRHWFRVRARGADIKVFDVVSFFATDFVGALRSFEIRAKLCAHGKQRCSNECNCVCVLCHVEREKLRRSEFVFSEIQEIAVYMRLELELGVELMNRLREVFRDAGFDPRSWHGPGALARMALNRHDVKAAMAETPADVRIACQYAFAGGRFEMFRAGHFKQKIYNADINSAYPYYASMLPNLSRGKWRRTSHYEDGKFALYYIQYSAPAKRTRDSLLKPYPLYRRHSGGNVEWPNRVEGWYWNPEAAIVCDDPDATFVEGWIFDETDSDDKPFAWIVDYYRKRQILKKAGNSAEFTFKLVINSIYGQLAQRTGWDKKNKRSPKFHQLEWAGWITSACRAYVYKLAVQCGESLISIDTDGLYSLRPISGLDIGTGLGQIETAEFHAGIFWQSGIYALYSGETDTWVKAKTRGIPRGTYSAEQMIESMNRDIPLRMRKKVFTGFGLALNGQREKLNSWCEEPHEFLFGGQGKRYHNPRGCKNGTTCSDTWHGLIPVPRRIRPGESTASRAHYLPWQETDKDAEANKREHWDVVMFDANDLSEDDRWTLDAIQNELHVA